MRNVIICKGLPASGKTDWAKKVIDDFPNAYKRVNKDDLRSMLDNSKWSKDAEKFILNIRDCIIVEALTAGKHIIVDDTNLAPKHIEHIKELVKKLKFDVKVIIQDFTEVSLATCLERDRSRFVPVGDKTIRGMYERYIKQDPIPVEHNPDLPNAIICDLDGTLSLLNGRNPYDASTCTDDLLCGAVADIIKGRHIILLSGRSDRFLPQTKEFLDKHEIDYQALYMRKEGDQRKDFIVKKEIYDTYIKGKYNIDFILDDRNQIVDMWRAEGLKCLQVAEGNF